MTVNLTDEQRELQAMARQIAEGELRPHAAEWDAAAEIPADVFRTLGELGFMGMLLPEAYGGLELDVVTYLVVLEELARADASTALAVAIHSGVASDLLLRHGSEEQRREWLPRLASGEIVGTFALSQEGAGGDASEIGCTATPVDGGWSLAGAKEWVTNGRRAGLALVFARTGRDGSPAEGVGCFLVEPSSDGYTVTGRTTTMGFRASETVSVALEGVRADPVGDPDRGFEYVREALDLGRLGIAAIAVGVGRAALDHSVRYAQEREQFGRQIARFGAIQEKLATIAARVDGAGTFVRDVGRQMDRSRQEGDEGVTGRVGVRARAAGAKLVASQTAMWAADEAVQLFGGYGYMRDYPVEKLMRDAKGTEIYEGTSEVLRHVIARELLRDGRVTA